MLGHSGVTVKEAPAFFAPHFVKAGFAVLGLTPTPTYESVAAMTQ
ncbi:hypothetical protein [Nonomuraea sp. NPDC049758]